MPPRIATLTVLLALVVSPALAKSRKGSIGTPFTPYPGAEYSKKASERYRDDRGADKAWAFAVKSKFKKVAAFYKKQVGGSAKAETESKGFYFAITEKSEIRVEKKKGGWVVIYMALKDLPKSSGSEGSGMEGDESSRRGGMGMGGPGGPGYGPANGGYPGSSNGPGGDGNGMQNGPGMGMQNGPGMGMQNGPGNGMQGGPGNGMQNGPGMGMQNGPGMGMQGGPGMGMQNGPGMGPSGGSGGNGPN